MNIIQMKLNCHTQKSSQNNNPIVLSILPQYGQESCHRDKYRYGDHSIIVCPASLLNRQVTANKTLVLVLITVFSHYSFNREKLVVILQTRNPRRKVFIVRQSMTERFINFCQLEGVSWQKESGKIDKGMDTIFSSVHRAEQ